MSKTGTATAIPPPYFDHMDEILSEKPTTKPALVIQSSSIRSVRDEGEDLLFEVENNQDEEETQKLEPEKDDDMKEPNFPELKRAKKAALGELNIT